MALESEIQDISVFFLTVLDLFDFDITVSLSDLHFNATVTEIYGQ